MSVRVSSPRFYRPVLISFACSVYEFIQRRSDWKRIEKVVDKVSLLALFLASNVS